jgi:hypothetical protein
MQRPNSGWIFIGHSVDGEKIIVNTRGEKGSKKYWNNAEVARLAVGRKTGGSPVHINDPNFG